MRNDSKTVRYGLKKYKTGLVSAALATVFIMSPGVIEASETSDGTYYNVSHTLDNSAQSQDTYAENHINDLNNYRAENGKAPLVEQDDLNAFAKWKIDALGEYLPTIDDIRAFRENGGNIHEFNGRTVTEQYIDYYGHAPKGYLGENVAYFKNIPGTNTNDGLSDVTMDTWINSPVHDRNMKEDGYGSVGSAYYMDGKGTYYTIQIFETGHREVTEIAPEDIPEDEDIITEPPVTPETETDTPDENVTTPEDVKPELEVEKEPETPEAVEPEEDVSKDDTTKPEAEVETEVDSDIESDDNTEEIEEESNEIETNPSDDVDSNESEEIEVVTPEDDEVFNDSEEETVVEETEDTETSTDEEVSEPVTESNDTDVDSTPENTEVEETPVSDAESDIEMIAEAPDDPVTPLEDADTALTAEGDNGSDNTEIVPQNTSVSVGDKESYEIELISEEPVEAISLIDESTADTDENVKNEQALPNTGTTDQSTSVLLGSVMALLSGIGLWFTRRRKADN